MEGNKLPPIRISTCEALWKYGSAKSILGKESITSLGIIFEDRLPDRCGTTKAEVAISRELLSEELKIHSHCLLELAEMLLFKPEIVACWW